MSMQSEVVEERDIKLRFLKRKFSKKVILGVAALVCVMFVVIGVKTVISFKNKTTKIGFEDIGELATQTAYCTELNVIENSKDLFGVKIPFTQSKYIYSYDIAIKAGFDFKDIKWRENGTSIEVNLPEAKVLSSDIDLDSFKIYHEQESIFNQITMTNNNDAMNELKQKAEDEAVANGLLKNARANVETILTGFFGNAYDLKKYDIVFKDN